MLSTGSIPEVVFFPPPPPWWKKIGGLLAIVKLKWQGAWVPVTSPEGDLGTFSWVCKLVGQALLGSSVSTEFSMKSGVA